MRVYVIRHGESEANLNKQWTGWLDVPLTDKGKADAKKAAALLKGTSFDKVYTSDLKRATQTAHIALPDCTYEQDSLLREINVGSLVGTPLTSINYEERLKVLSYGYAEFGGETRAELYQRIKEFMKKIEDQNLDTIAVFCHAGWLLGMLDIVLGGAVNKRSVCCNNCTVAVFEYTDNNWKLFNWINPT